MGFLSRIFGKKSKEIQKQRENQETPLHNMEKHRKYQKITSDKEVAERQQGISSIGDQKEEIKQKETRSDEHIRKYISENLTRVEDFENNYGNSNRRHNGARKSNYGGKCDFYSHLYCKKYDWDYPECGDCSWKEKHTYFKLPNGYDKDVEDDTIERSIFKMFYHDPDRFNRENYEDVLDYLDYKYDNMYEK